MNRDKWKILNHRNNYGRVATLQEISECAKVLNLNLGQALVRKVPANIWDYYQDRKGGRCYG